MPTDQGKLVGCAFKIVRQCHEDVARLVADLDSFMIENSLERISKQDAVTSGISRAAYAPFWMAIKLFRLYHGIKDNPNIVEGINIRFFKKNKQLDEPLLIVGRIAYRVPETESVKDIHKPWDLDNGYHTWCNASQEDLGKSVSINGADEGRVVRMSLVARDLYSIQTLDDITSMLEQVRTNFKEQANG